MTSDELPQPETHGALVPPDQHPPTTLDTDTPEPPRPPRRAWYRDIERSIDIGPDLKAAMNKVLDTIDDVAEAIAVELHIRPARNRPSSTEPPAP
jgi:hypothetical protein